MSETLPNYLTLPFSLIDDENLKSHLKLRLIKQIIVSQVLYVLSVWRNLMLIKYPDKTFKIGIIGCGVIGKLILNSIIPFTKRKDTHHLKTWQMEVSTRRPETMNLYENLGVKVYFDNEKLIQNCDFIIIGLPPTLDNWTLLELKSSIQKKVKSQNKPFILSLISNVSTLKIQRVLQIEEHMVCTTQVKQPSIDNVLDEYIQQAKLLISQQKEKFFQTEVDEIIAHLIKREAFNHFYGDTNFMERISNLLNCFSQCVVPSLNRNQQESCEFFLKIECISQSLLGRTYQELKEEHEKSKLNFTFYLMQALNKGFDKRFYEYQNLLQQNQKD